MRRQKKIIGKQMKYIYKNNTSVKKVYYNKSYKKNKIQDLKMNKNE